jgi:subtilisin family serine protease
MKMHSPPRAVRAPCPWFPLAWAWPLALAVALPSMHPGLGSPRSRGHDIGLGEEALPQRLPTTAPAPVPQLWQEQLARMGADRWHAAGFRGQGVKVAVLDTGFRGYRAYLGTALPARVTVRSFRDDGDLEAKDSTHGILCGEVLHRVAPDAELLFANWDWNCPDQFLRAVRWAREQGARVISCSCVMPSWSDGDGSGAIHHELASVLGPGASPGDVLCFASAGNTSDRHWGGFFKDGGDGFHQWQPGSKDNHLRPWGDEPIMVELYAHPGSDYALYVYDAVSGKEIEHARTSGQTGDRSSAAVRFPPGPGHNYLVRVRLLHGPAGMFHLTTTYGSLEYTVARNNVCFPADGATVVAMGAVDGQGQRQPYSACGPNSPRPKPDFVAAVPVPTQIRERAFGGTSAAAPQGAALAALIWSRHAMWTPDHVRSALRAAAADLGPPGHDFETGYGLLRLPKE